jgi:hypothetical protein
LSGSIIRDGESRTDDYFIATVWYSIWVPGRANTPIGIIGAGFSNSLPIDSDPPQDQADSRAFDVYGFHGVFGSGIQLIRSRGFVPYPGAKRRC